MTTPQPGILDPDKAHALFIIGKARPRADLVHIKKVLRQSFETAQEISAIDRHAQFTCAVGFGPKLWDRLSPGKRPKRLRPFKAVKQGKRAAPATGGDLWIHIASDRHDLNMELAMRLEPLLAPDIVFAEMVHGYRYLDSRDLTGFIDGTENPKGDERAQAALIGKEDPEFEGGSYVAAQRYVHNLERWRTIDVSEQERVIGRTKPDSRELSDSRKPPTAHIARVVIEENGKELEILRHSYPYGTLRERGLFFVAYTKDLDIFDRMLARMMGASGDGLHDRLMDFTRPVTGAAFFVPARESLNNLMERP